MTPPPRAWAPLLEGDEAAAALAVVRQIAHALAEASARTLYHEHEVALLQAYAGEVFDDAGAWARAERFVDRAVARLPTSSLSVALGGGIAGISWVVAHLCDGDADDDIAVALTRLVDVSPWRQPVDLLAGLGGIAVYGLARPVAPAAARLLASIVARLEENAERDADGCRWLTPPALLHASYDEHSPNGHYDLGLAHGAAGIIGVLARLFVAGVEPARTRALLVDAVRWLRAQALPGGSSVYPHFVVPGRTPSQARNAWCYGDGGIALALLSAGRALGDDELNAHARAVARKAALRGDGDSGVVDAGLCHGAAGLGHLFHRLHRATDEPACRDAAVHWFRRCMALREPDRGIGGFLALKPDGDNSAVWREDASLLTGASGIALALLAAAGGVEPGWDELLLMRVVDGG